VFCRRGFNLTKITIGGIFTAIILLIIFSQLPSGDMTDSVSTIKNVQQNLVMDTAVNAGGQAINDLSEQLIDNACRDTDSISCHNIKKTASMIALTWMIVIVAVIIDGLIGFSKWIVKITEYILDF
jgi:hypothetical protein